MGVDVSPSNCSSQATKLLQWSFLERDDGEEEGGVGLCIGRGKSENRRWGKKKKKLEKRVRRERDDREREGKKKREGGVSK